LVRCERFLECLKVSHPFECKGVGLSIRLVEDDYKRKLGLVEDTGGGLIRTRAGPMLEQPTCRHRAYST
jgi:hypothetical protein